jgi:hypothetical protein
LEGKTQLVVAGSEGSGKTYLAKEVFMKLTSSGYLVLLLQPATPKQLITEIALALNIRIKSLEGRSIKLDELKYSVLDALPKNDLVLIFDDAHLLDSKFRQWIKQFREREIAALLLATNPPRTDVFIAFPRVILSMLPDYAIRELMEDTAIKRGLNLSNSKLSKLQQSCGGNPMFAIRVIEEEYLGVKMIESGDSQEMYFDVTPLILICGIIFMVIRFIGLGTSDQSLYIFGGISAAIFTGFALVLRSLPRENKKIN